MRKPVLGDGLARDGVHPVHQAPAPWRGLWRGRSRRSCLRSTRCHQRQHRAGGDAHGGLPRLPGRAGAGALTGNAQLQQHLEAALERTVLGPGLDGVHLPDRVDQEHRTQARALGVQQRERVQLGALDHLVGNQQHRHAMARADGRLEHGGEADAPGPRAQLHLPQLGRHAGLAVWREVQAARARRSRASSAGCAAGPTV